MQQKIKSPEIIMIVAMTESGLIGNGDKMAWKSATDFNWFKAQTIGWPMLFGRKTAAGMPKFPLSNRPCSMLSEQIREPNFFGNNGAGPVFSNFNEAIQFHKNFDKLFIGGGKSIYEYALAENKPFGNQLAAIDMSIHYPLVDTVIRTVFPDGYADGDIYFKELEQILKEQFQLEDEYLFTLENSNEHGQEYMFEAPCAECHYREEDEYEEDGYCCGWATSAEENEVFPCQKGLPAELLAKDQPLKKSDTPFPWIRFETWRLEPWRRNKHR